MEEKILALLESIQTDIGLMKRDIVELNTTVEKLNNKIDSVEQSQKRLEDRQKHMEYRIDLSIERLISVEDNIGTLIIASQRTTAEVNTLRKIK